MTKPPYNDPFYFALPYGSSADTAGKAVDHIAATFGVIGKVEVVRRELAFTLCKITAVSA